MTAMIIFAILFVIIAICVVVKIQQNQEMERQRITNDIYSRGFLYYKDFENRWIISSARKYGRGNGFKYQDGPGCYVITIYDHPIEYGEVDDYENVYVGQSVNMCQRVHAHFNGKGNGDVYADIKYGKWVYVSLVPCEKQDMNRVEKELIAAFHATDSYNRTRGGARDRNYYN